MTRSHSPNHHHPGTPEEGSSLFMANSFAEPTFSSQSVFIKHPLNLSLNVISVRTGAHFIWKPCVNPQNVSSFEADHHSPFTAWKARRMAWNVTACAGVGVFVVEASLKAEAALRWVHIWFVGGGKTECSILLNYGYSLAKWIDNGQFPCEHALHSPSQSVGSVVWLVMK